MNGAEFDSEDTIFEGNFLFGNGTALLIKPSSRTNLTILDNKIENVSLAIYGDRRGDQTKIINNLIKNCEEGVILKGDLYLVENNTFIDCGKIVKNDNYFSSYSPVYYNGQCYDYVYFDNSALDTYIQVDEDWENVSKIVNGTNNFSLWLGHIGSDYYTVYVEEPPAYDCATAFAAQGGTCDFEQEKYWIANGYGQNYTLNQSSQVSVCSGYTDPAWLRYNLTWEQTNFSIKILGDNQITRNIIKDENKNNNYSIYSNSTTSQVWLNHLLSGGIFGLTPVCCVNGEGNFYPEESQGVPSEDCGQSKLKTSIGNRVYGKITLSWTPQSSLKPVTYDIYLINYNLSNSTLLASVQSTSYSWDTSPWISDYAYKLRIVPWISGSRINATPIETGIFFVIEQPPKPTRRPAGGAPRYYAPPALICDPGELRCSGNLLQRCNLAGTGWETIQNCTWGCNSTLLKCNPQPFICNPGELKCEDNRLLECNGTDWLLKEECEWGCNSTLLKCNPQPFICEPGERRCRNNTVEECNGTAWVQIEVCTDYCEDGECKTYPGVPWLIIIATLLAVLLVIGLYFYLKPKAGKAKRKRK
ncbi:hypothetical protein DRQ09_03530 [candidate division KSB1 bacterium]|nr:MAG: hypothetical protein DRQ09_03530 [candidate division KSB1 bacterium]